MRNFVECCLGGVLFAGFDIGQASPLEPNDVLLVCTDGCGRGGYKIASDSARQMPLRQALLISLRGGGANRCCERQTSAAALRGISENDMSRPSKRAPDECGP